SFISDRPGAQGSPGASQDVRPQRLEGFWMLLGVLVVHQIVEEVGVVEVELQGQDNASLGRLHRLEETGGWFGEGDPELEVFHVTVQGLIGLHVGASPVGGVVEVPKPVPAPMERSHRSHPRLVHATNELYQGSVGLSTRVRPGASHGAQHEGGRICQAWWSSFPTLARVSTPG